MAIKSMTGFAREAGSTGPHRWAWELRTVNGRGLDIRLRTPPGFDELGEAARRTLAATLSRGQCQLTLTVARAAAAPLVRVNQEALAALLQGLAALKLPPSVAPASLDGLLAVRGIVEVEDGGAEAFDESLKADLVAAAGRLAHSVQASRAEEGASLAAALHRQLDAIGALVAAAEVHPGRTPEAIRARLESQVQALLGAAPALDPARLHQEAALLATRADIREELDRLGAHLAAAKTLLEADGPVGRRLDFLAQEFGRECNTLCAKANDAELSRIGLDLKAVVEQLREQVQNVE